MTISDQAEQISFDKAELVLELTLGCGDLISTTSRSLFMLRQKRRTLEEKAISSYFHKAIQRVSAIVLVLHESLEHGQENKLDDAELLLLQATIRDLQSRVDELLKILRYNLNFLEQYFEYDFFGKLSTESCAIENLDNVHRIVLDRMKESMST